MSLTSYSSLVSFVSSKLFSMKFKAFQLRKNSGFVNEVNIGKEAIFDVCNTSTSLRGYAVTSPPSRLATSELATKERSRHQAKSSRHQPPIKRLVEESRMFFMFFLFFLLFFYCSLRSPRASYCSSEKHEK